MTRARFMEELSRMLSDLPETERQEALEYYENYFEDAGPEREAQVLQELGSPGKVAAIIKAAFRETSPSQYGEYTERGYQDSRTEETRQMPVGYEDGRKRASGQQTDTENRRAYSEREYHRRRWDERRFSERVRKRRERNRSPRLLLAIILLVFLSPLWGGILTAIAGVLIGVICVPIAIVIAFAGSAIAFLISGVLVIGMAIAGILGSISGITIAAGFLMTGIGFLLLAVGILLLLAAVASVKNTVRIVLFLVRKGTEGISRMIYKVKGGLA